jgi:hypothetical protein
MTKAKALVLAVLLIFLAVPAFAAEKVNIGPNLPPFTLEAPTSAEVQKYLGLEKMEPFGLTQIQGKMVMIEIMSAL